MGTTRQHLPNLGGIMRAMNDAIRRSTWSGRAGARGWRRSRRWTSSAGYALERGHVWAGSGSSEVLWTATDLAVARRSTDGDPVPRVWSRRVRPRSGRTERPEVTVARVAEHLGWAGPANRHCLFARWSRRSSTSGGLLTDVSARTICDQTGCRRTVQTRGESGRRGAGIVCHGRLPG